MYCKKCGKEISDDAAFSLTAAVYRKYHSEI